MELLGKRVRYAGEDGRVVEGEATSEAYVVIMIRSLGNATPRLVRVAEPEWERIEIIG